MHNKGSHWKTSKFALNRAAILALANQGATLTEIVRQFGSGRTRMREFLRQNGVMREFSKSNPREKHGNWKGGRLIDQDDYVLVYAANHPSRRRLVPYMLEHRLVMEQHLGRCLHPSEVVHHRNKNKQDNRIENLELFSSNADHLASELAGHCPKWTAEGRRRILERKNRRGGNSAPRILPKGSVNGDQLLP